LPLDVFCTKPWNTSAALGSPAAYVPCVQAIAAGSCSTSQ
jgi:hypothetical protein